MWPYIILIGALVCGTLITQTNTRAVQNASSTEATAIAGSMRVYRNAVVAYAAAHPATTGAVADASLALPSWFNKFNGVSNYVAAGKAYVYYTATQPQLTYLIVKASNNSINAGIKQGGNLINPLSSTNTSIPISLPAAIPDGSVVIAY